MVLHNPGQRLSLEDRRVPDPGAGQILIRVTACAVCRTDLHIVDGELEEPSLPLVPGHQVVGRVSASGPRTESRFSVGDRVGVPWLGWTCGSCRYCVAGTENLCAAARFTGYTVDGGYAEFMVADERFAVPVPAAYDDVEASPLFCAGMIGYRSLAKTGDARCLGIYGFGSAAHIVTQVARFEGREVYAFTRSGDLSGQEFARSVGCSWAGGADQTPPCELDAAIVFAPVGALVPLALESVRRGGVVVCGGIHMSDIPAFPYRLLWGERRIESVANLTRRDAEQFMAVASRTRIRTTTERFGLEQAPEALDRLRAGRVEGAVVLVPDTHAVRAAG
jgi:propanol-preferring alcohol dehydrogenase